MEMRTVLLRLCVTAAVLIFTCSGLPAEPVSRTLPQGGNPFVIIIPLKTCYDKIGCFSTSGNFYDLLRRPIQLLPQSPRDIGPTYALYTRRNEEVGQEIIYESKATVTSSNFNASLPTKFIIHGFMSSGSTEWVATLKRALLLHGDYNVFQVDWSRGNKMPYTQATANTRVVGALIAQLIEWLETEFGASRKDVHLLGHSLGAHVSGYAGERLRGLGRITGMDPAGPYFEGTHPEVRLDPTDAMFVDAIHTDGTSLLSSPKVVGGFGMMEPVGHVDFYPNGGKKQTDCTQNPIESIVINGIAQGAQWAITCDHLRVVPLMTSTVRHLQGNYKAIPCDSYENFKAGKCANCGRTGCAFMGMRAAEWKPPAGVANVKMFLDTSGANFFDVHNYVVRVTISGVPASKKQLGDLYITMESETGQRSQQKALFLYQYLHPGEIQGVVLTGSDGVTNVARITVSWRVFWMWVAISWTKSLYIDRIEIFEAMTEKRSLFCANTIGFYSGTYVTLQKSAVPWC